MWKLLDEEARREGLLRNGDVDFLYHLYAFREILAISIVKTTPERERAAMLIGSIPLS